MLVRAPLRKLPTWAEIRSIPLNAGYGPLWVQVTALSGHCHLSVYALSCMAREGRLSHSHRCPSIKAKHGCVGRRCLACPPGWPGPPRPGTRTHNPARTTGLRRTRKMQGHKLVAFRWNGNCPIAPTTLDSLRAVATRPHEGGTEVRYCWQSHSRVTWASTTPTPQVIACRPVSNCPAAGGVPRVAPSGF
jgi:hypothetical protein